MHIACPMMCADKAALVAGLLAAKQASGKTFDQIAGEVGLTNAYTAQLFYNQAQLKPQLREALAKAVPRLTKEQLAAMAAPPLRSFDPGLLQEPLVYRLNEVGAPAQTGLTAVGQELLGWRRGGGQGCWSGHKTCRETCPPRHAHLGLPLTFAGSGALLGQLVQWCTVRATCAMVHC